MNGNTTAARDESDDRIRRSRTAAFRCRGQQFINTNDQYAALASRFASNDRSVFLRCNLDGSITRHRILQRLGADFASPEPSQ